MRALSLAVVGADHANKRGPTRRFEIAITKPGEPIELRPEPKNPADEHAIAVYSPKGVQLGYLTAERAPWIGGMIRNGREIDAIFQSAATFGCWVRIAFDGERAVLPPAREREDVEPDDAGDGDSGFWPDEVYDEE